MISPSLISSKHSCQSHCADIQGGAIYARVMYYLANSQVATIQESDIIASGFVKMRKSKVTYGTMNIFEGHGCLRIVCLQRK